MVDINMQGVIHFDFKGRHPSMVVDCNNGNVTVGHKSWEGLLNIYECDAAHIISKGKDDSESQYKDLLKIINNALKRKNTQ